MNYYKYKNSGVVYYGFETGILLSYQQLQYICR